MIYAFSYELSVLVDGYPSFPGYGTCVDLPILSAPPGSSFQIVVKAGDREAALGEIKKLKPKIAVPDVVWVIKTGLVRRLKHLARLFSAFDAAH